MSPLHRGGGSPRNQLRSSPFCYSKLILITSALVKLMASSTTSLKIDQQRKKKKIFLKTVVFAASLFLPPRQQVDFIRRCVGEAPLLWQQQQQHHQHPPWLSHAWAHWLPMYYLSSLLRLPISWPKKKEKKGNSTRRYNIKSRTLHDEPARYLCRLALHET